MIVFIQWYIEGNSTNCPRDWCSERNHPWVSEDEKISSDCHKSVFSITLNIWLDTILIFDNNHILFYNVSFLINQHNNHTKKCKKYLQNVKFVGIFHFLSIFIETCLKTYLQLWFCCFFIGANEIPNGVCKVVH